MRGYLKPARWDNLSYKEVQQKLGQMRSTERYLNNQSIHTLVGYEKNVRGI